MISLVLATVGRVVEIERLFVTLLGQSDRDFEVIIVDQNGDDRLAPVVSSGRERGLSVQHLRLRPPNLSAARNLGITAASGSIVGFPDDDCWYEADAIEKVKLAFGVAIAPGGVVGCWLEQRARDPAPLHDGAVSASDWRRFRGGDASSITLFFQTALLRKLGGFDVRFGVGRWFGCGEETDLVLRTLASGAPMQRVSSIRVHHHVADTRERLSLSSLKRALDRGRGIGGLYAKHSLELSVVFRGFVSGWINPVLKLDGLGPLLLGPAESIGRLHGFVRWKTSSTQMTGSK